MSQPTLRPWYTDDTYGDIRTKNRTLLMRQAPSNANRLTQEEKIANAALIVRAVNAHDALVEVLTLVKKHSQQWPGDIPHLLVKQVDAALALAQAKDGKEEKQQDCEYCGLAICASGGYGGSGKYCSPQCEVLAKQQVR